MLKLKNRVVGITLGDPGGIGPEIVAKALAQPLFRNRADFIVIGDARVYRYYTKNLKGIHFVDLNNFPINKSILGGPSRQGARASLEYIDKAIDLLKEKKISALVTAPVSKESICSLGVKFHGHTEYLADAFKINRFEMMFVTNALKVVLVTRHVPLKQVSSMINQHNVYEAIVLTFDALRKKFCINNPRIAVCGLNPHCGEGGEIGKEEIFKIIPAIQKARRKGMKVVGPLAADTLFIPKQRKLYDAVVSMYHDQGLIAIKSLYFGEVVNFTYGLPFIRTSPTHGTAFNITGKNMADPSSMTHAIKLAVKLMQHASNI